MTRHIRVSLLIAPIFLDVVKVVSSHYQGVFHLSSTNHKTFQNTASNRHVSSERAFLIDIVSVNRRLGGRKSQSYILVVPEALKGGKTIINWEAHGKTNSKRLPLCCSDSQGVFPHNPPSHRIMGAIQKL